MTRPFRRCPLGLGLALAGLWACQSDPVRITRAPTAFGGYDQTVVTGQEVVLDANASLDPDGDPLRIHWALERAPSGSSSSIDPPTNRIARIVPDLPGTYLLSLTVGDGTFEDRDLIGLSAVEADSSSVSLELTVGPSVCTADFADIFASSCGVSDRRVSVTPERLRYPPGAESQVEVAWSFLKLPPGVTEGALDIGTPSGPLGELTFLVPRPGDYWIGARLVGLGASSPLSVAAISVFDGLPLASARPTPHIDGPARIMLSDRALLDGRQSSIPTASVAGRIERRWQLLSDPSGRDQLSDVATGCAPTECRLLFPSAAGTYLISHQIIADGVAGGTALFALEVE